MKHKLLDIIQQKNDEIGLKYDLINHRYTLNNTLNNILQEKKHDFSYFQNILMNSLCNSIDTFHVEIMIKNQILEILKSFDNNKVDIVNTKFYELKMFELLKYFMKLKVVNKEIKRQITLFFDIYKDYRNNNLVHISKKIVIRPSVPMFNDVIKIWFLCIVVKVYSLGKKKYDIVENMIKNEYRNSNIINIFSKIILQFTNDFYRMFDFNFIIRSFIFHLKDLEYYLEILYFLKFYTLSIKQKKIQRVYIYYEKLEKKIKNYQNN